MVTLFALMAAMKITALILVSDLWLRWMDRSLAPSIYYGNSSLNW